MHVKEIFISFRDRILTHGRLLSICFLIVIFGIGFINIPQLIREAYQNSTDSTLSLQQKLNNIQSALGEELTGKIPFINLNGLAHRIMGQREMNFVYKLSNGTLYSLVDQEDTAEEAAATISFRAELENRGIQYTYVAAPSQINVENASYLLPLGVCDFSDYNITSFVVPLENNGVDVLDLRIAAQQQNKDLQSMFFRTDHHWLPETGFWAFQEIVHRLANSEAGYPESYVTDFSNYHIETFKNVLLGSYGRRTGALYAGLDDLDIIIPDFETNISAVFLDADGNEYESWSGDFSNVFYDWDKLKKDDYFNSEIYTVYGWGYPMISIYKNQNAPCAKKVLLITDSYGQVVKPFLSLYFSEVYSIAPFDYRTMSYLDYVDYICPDNVIMLYSSSVFSREGFNYF